MNAARKLILLVLAVMLTFQGCAGTLRCLDHGADSHAGSFASAGDDAGLQQTRHRHPGVRAALYAAVGVIIIGAFIADLFILPYSCYSRRHYFPCCTEVVRWCH